MHLRQQMKIFVVFSINFLLPIIIQEVESARNKTLPVHSKQRSSIRAICRPRGHVTPKPLIHKALKRLIVSSHKAFKPRNLVS